MFRPSRSGPPPSAGGPRDPHLPMLSVEQARALATLAERAFAERGVPAVSDGAGVLHVPGGQQYGLHNLAVAASTAPWRQWRRLVERHVSALLAVDTAADALDADSLLLRLRKASDLPAQPDYDAASRLPGLLAVLAQDTPQMVRELLKQETFAHLGDAATLRQQAVANLARLPTPELQTISPPEDPATAVHVFAGDDYFVASRLLVLPTLLAATLGVEDPDKGCVVAVPNRHLLAVHVVVDLGVITAVNLMAVIAEAECESRAGPITDEVFYLPRTGPGQSIVSRDDGRITVTAEGAFARVLTEL